jgi:hypothetical protein
MPRGAASVLLATGVISVTTAATRLSQVPLRALAATPQSLAEGRIWLLATSALVADRPAFASILGFLVVGIAAVWLCGSRVVWVAAASGHIFSAAIVYVGIGLVRLADPGAFESTLGLQDFGTSVLQGNADRARLGAPVRPRLRRRRGSLRSGARAPAATGLETGHRLIENLEEPAQLKKASDRGETTWNRPR